MTRQRVLFLCTHNSARSQMAEAMLRAWAGDLFEAFSAGTEATEVRPLAIAAMDELGVDMRGHESKTIERFLDQQLDWAITVCDPVCEACPYLPGTHRHAYWPVDDPSAATGTEAERLVVYRRVRDEIAGRIRAFIATQSVRSEASS